MLFGNDTEVSGIFHLPQSPEISVGVNGTTGFPFREFQKYKSHVSRI